MAPHPKKGKTRKRPQRTNHSSSVQSRIGRFPLARTLSNRSPVHSLTSHKRPPSVTVKSASDIEKVMQMILVHDMVLATIVAGWCGHCHKLLPHLNEAIHHPSNRTATAIIPDTMVDQFNSALKSRVNPNAHVEVDSYPTSILLKKDGTEVTPRPNLAPDTKQITQFLNRTGPLATQANLTSMAATTGPIETRPPRGQATTLYQPTMKNSPTSDEDIIGHAEGAEGIETTKPSDDAISQFERTDTQTKSKGGSLYSAMAQTAYTLAPAAVLMATASAMMRKKPLRTHKRRHYKTR
jgi:hypothetical protein